MWSRELWSGKGELIPPSRPLPLPCDPNILLLGVKPEKCGIFKSALTPLRITFDAVNTTTSVDRKDSKLEVGNSQDA